VSSKKNMAHYDANRRTDHDIDSKNQEQINVFGARGVLIESRGPSWVHSASNEHSTLYNWQLDGAKNIYLGHIQSETPYFQAAQLTAKNPYFPGEIDMFFNDPEFPDCDDVAEGNFDTCSESWALRILYSRNVYLYGGGFYSFFKGYKDTCAKFGQTCQDKLIDTSFSERIYLYNLFTIGANEIISPQGLDAVPREGNINGFATATSAWLLLSNTGSNIGGTRKTDVEMDDDEQVITDFGCDLFKRYDSLEDLGKDTSRLSSYCVTVYTLDVLSRMIDNAMVALRSAPSDYDKKFNEYSEIFKRFMEDQLAEFIQIPSGDGAKYFTCKVGDKETAKCHKLERTPETSAFYDVTYSLDDSEPFWDELEKKTGIQKAWVYMKDAEDRYKRMPYANDKPGINQPFQQTFRNFPKLKDKYDVPNPRDVLAAALPKASRLQLMIGITRLEVKIAAYPSDMDIVDTIQSYSIPAFLLSQAVANMDQVVTIGAEAQKKKKIELILTVLGAVFAIVPFIGEIGALAAGLTTLARIMGTMGVVSNTALGITDAVEHPDMAPLAIMGILLAAPGLRLSSKELKDMASLRKIITSDVAKGAGATFSKHDTALQKILRGSCKNK
jgi:hypothetical protein